MTHLDRFIGSYGRTWLTGVITEHEYLFIEAGGTTRIPASGARRYALIDGEPVPFVCSELIEVPTEDGPIVGRCGIPVAGDEWACEGHATERAAWERMDEVERLAWERRMDATA